MYLSKYLTTITPFSKFLAILLFTSLPFIGFWFGMKYQQVNPIDENITVNDKVCTNQTLGISLKLPSGWSCEIQNPNTDAWITISSKIFTIHISNIGRGPYCGDGELSEESTCKINPYYNNNRISLSLFNYGGKDREIFGMIKNKNNPWMSIKYSDMKSRKLSTEESKELRNVLDSLEILDLNLTINFDSFVLNSFHLSS